MFGRLFSMMGRQAVSMSSFKNLVTGAKIGSPLKNLATNTLIGGAIAFATSPQETRVKDTAKNLASSYLFMGFGWKGQVFGPMLLNAAFHAGDTTRHVGGVLRGAISSRSMAAVPFSHSTQGMDLAYASYNSTKQAMGNQNSIVGDEAAIMASRYLSR